MKPERKHFIDTLADLLAADEQPHGRHAGVHGGTAADDWRKAARWRWLHDTALAWMSAQRGATAAWDRMMAQLPDDLSDEELEALELPDPPEEAEVNALWRQLDDVVQKDLWPKELYFGGI